MASSRRPSPRQTQPHASLRPLPLTHGPAGERVVRRRRVRLLAHVRAQSTPKRICNRGRRRDATGPSPRTLGASQRCRRSRHARWRWYTQGRRHVPTNEADERGVSVGDFRVDPDAHRRRRAFWPTHALYGARWTRVQLPGLARSTLAAILFRPERRAGTGSEAVHGCTVPRRGGRLRHSLLAVVWLFLFFPCRVDQVMCVSPDCPISADIVPSCFGSS
jgi:hypothetical protein